MKSMVLNVDDSVYDKLVDFLEILPQDKIKIVEDITCSKQLVEQLADRRWEVVDGNTLTHTEFWEEAG